jgi:hypothetical protein
MATCRPGQKSHPFYNLKNSQIYTWHVDPKNENAGDQGLYPINARENYYTSQSNYSTHNLDFLGNTNKTKKTKYPSSFCLLRRTWKEAS